MARLRKRELQTRGEQGVQPRQMLLLLLLGFTSSPLRIRAVGSLGQGGPQSLGFSLHDPCVRICSSARQSFALSCKSFAERFLLQSSCLQTNPRPRPAAGTARFARLHEDTRAIRYLQARTFPGGFVLPCWLSTAMRQGSAPLAAVARGCAVGDSWIYPDCTLKGKEAPLWGQGREGESFALMSRRLSKKPGIAFHSQLARRRLTQNPPFLCAHSGSEPKNV